MDWVTVGRVVKPHGIRGEVVVHVLSDLPGRIAPGVEVRLGDPAAPATAVLACRPHQGRLLVRFADVEDRSAAELLRGRTVLAAPMDVTDQETYFAHELVGLPVRADDGRLLGTVSALVELPEAAGYDLLEVDGGDGRTWLLPAVEAYVEVEVDADGALSLVLRDAPEGLLEVQAPAPAPRAGDDHG